MVTVCVNLRASFNTLKKMAGRMMIRTRLTILLVSLCALAVVSLLAFGLAAQQEARYVQSYGWSDPVRVFGPETRPTPPQIAATFTPTGGLVVVWDSPDEETKIVLARSTDYATWNVTRLVWELTDSDSQAAVLADSEGAVWLAWRGVMGATKQYRDGRYLSGVFWTVSRDGGSTWEAPRGLAVFEANLSDLGVSETVYAKPQICQLADRIRVYYESNQDPASGWVWYRETGDGGATWGEPVQVAGSEPYDQLTVTGKGELLTVQRMEDLSIRVIVRDGLGRVESEKTIGYGWPSQIGEDMSGRIWAVWDRGCDEKARREYLLENGTVVSSAYVRDEIWFCTSMDSGRTWSDPVRLGSGGQSERVGVVMQSPRGGYLAVFAAYPGSETAPWAEAWRWSILAKQAESIKMAKVKVSATWVKP